MYSEEYKKRSNDSSYQYHRGMNPALVPEIVRRAHWAGLKVSAHIYTATDFRNAVNGGVDLVAHFPGTGYDEKLGPAAFKITEADAVAAAQHHVRVLTTLGWPLRRLVRQRARSADPWPVHNGGVLSRWTLADSRRG